MTERFPVMLFAAGRGTRMAPLSDDRPKPLIVVDDRTLLDHALDQTNLPCISRRVVNVNYLGDMVRLHLKGRDVAISAEDPVLETGGGLRHALPLLGDGPVVTMNTDAVWKGPNPLAVLAQAWHPEMEGLLLLVPPALVRGHTGRGDFSLGEDGRLNRAPDLIYTGAQIIRTERLKEIGDKVFSLNTLWNIMAKTGGLRGVTYSGQWCDVGRPDSIPVAEAMLRAADV